MSDWVSFTPYLLIAAGIVVFGVLMIGVSVLEKQRIRQLEPASLDIIGPTSSYFDAMNSQAAAYGGVFCGYFVRMPRTPVTNCYLGAWLSPDRKTVAYVLGGKVAKINYRKTLLVGWLNDDTFIVTRDDFGEADHSRTQNIEVVLNADFGELAVRHAQRLQELAADPRQLHSGAVLDCMERMDEVRARKLVEMGLATFLDESNGVWRYTFRGGWRNFMNSISEMKASKKHMPRMNKKRPGS